MMTFGCSSAPQIRYVEVRISRSVLAGPLDFEITRVDCNYIPTGTSSERLRGVGRYTVLTMSMIPQVGRKMLRN